MFSLVGHQFCIINLFALNCQWKRLQLPIFFVPAQICIYFFYQFNWYFHFSDGCYMLWNMNWRSVQESCPLWIYTSCHPVRWNSFSWIFFNHSSKGGKEISQHVSHSIAFLTDWLHKLGFFYVWIFFPLLEKCFFPPIVYFLLKPRKQRQMQMYVLAQLVWDFQGYV